MIRSGEFIKIGIADNVEHRMAFLQVGNPVKLVLLRKFRTWDAPRMERELHDKLGQHRERGEWFRMETAVLAWIKSFDGL